MEGLKSRAFLVGVGLIAAGLVIQMAPATKLAPKDEKFMEQRAPTAVGDYRFYPDPTNKKPAQSYVIGDETYDVLKPFGIVGRVYASGGKSYDVLLISSNDKESFHDQRVCFTAQGWTLTDQTKEVVQTSRGPVPITLVRMKHSQLGERIAAFLYKGPSDRGLLPPIAGLGIVAGGAALLLGIAWLLVPGFFSMKRTRIPGFAYAILGIGIVAMFLIPLQQAQAKSAAQAGKAGFYAMPAEVTFAMLKEQLAGGTNLDSTFYRIIPSQESTKEELTAFIKSYLEEAEKVSGGYF